jgi:uncharacterized membrane protein YozB (DUF420 family)
MTTDFPAINASLNGASGFLLLCGYVLIRRRKIVAHATCMIAAVACSAAFLACYLYYHAHVGTTRVDDAFPLVRPGLRLLYKWVLFPHLTLAIVMLPMIIMTLTYAARRNWPKHLKIAPWTFGIWLYVSVTGVIIYWMLYHLFTGIQQTAR